jgi:hypothetical protein
MTYPPVEPGYRPPDDDVRQDDRDLAAWHRGAWLTWSLFLAVAVIAGVMLFWAKDTNDTRTTASHDGLSFGTTLD